MASSGSMKDLLKTISSCVTNANVPLPYDLLEVIQAFLDRRKTIEDSDSQRLHEELQLIYHKDVHEKPNRYSFFLALLRHLRPVLKGRRLLEWWDLLHLEVFNRLSEEKGLGNEAQSILLDILVYDQDGESSAEEAKISGALFDTLVKVWLENCHATAAEDPAAHLIRIQIQHVLLSFGRKRAKDFLRAINELFVQKKHRLQVLPLLCRFMQSQPPRLFELLQTPLFNNLLRCLTIDSSTTVVSLAISALVMFLPHIPFSMSKHLPSLFNIYSRLLFWDRECNTEPAEESGASEFERDSDAQTGISEDESPWEKLSYSFETDDSKVPELLQYFTILYGLYPINFMDYVRKPQRYLRHANYQGAEKVDIEPLEIRQRSEPYRQLHLLHPNFFNLTIESELADANRFLQIDAPEILTNCMALCNLTYAAIENSTIVPQIPDFRHVQPDDDIPYVPLLDREDDETIDGAQKRDWQDARLTGAASALEKREIPELKCDDPTSDSVSTGLASPLIMPREGIGMDSPTDAAHTRPPGPRSQLQDMLTSQQNLRGSSNQSLANDSNHSVVSSNLDPEIASTECQTQLSEPQVLVSKSPSLQPSQLNSGEYVASLHREIMLLKNDLNFERYLKQQHLSHIGQLRRKQIKEATVEAETQNLINNNRSLKNKLEEAKRSNLQIKREAEKSRVQLKKWEADLTLKLRSLRGEQKRWSAEGEILRRDLEVAKAQLKQLATDSEAVDLSKQQVVLLKLTTEENDRLKSEVEALTLRVRQLEFQEDENNHSQGDKAVAWTKVEMLNMKLQARDEVIEGVKKHYEAQIEDLVQKLDEATRDTRRRQLKGFQSMVDSALAASRIKISELQNEKTTLSKRYANLEYRYLQLREYRDLDDERPLLSRDSDSVGTSYHGGQFATNRGRQATTPTRRPQAMSDTDFEPSLSSSASPVAPALSTSYPERRNYGRTTGHSVPGRLEPSSHSPSHSRSFADRFHLGLGDRAANRFKGFSDAQSTSDIEGVGRGELNQSLPSKICSFTQSSFDTYLYVH